MKKMCALFVCIIMIIVTPLYAKEQDDPQIRFDISVQKEMKAHAIELTFDIEKKASTLPVTTRAMQELIAKIRKIADENRLASQDIQVQNTFMSSSDWLFGKDYVVNSRVKIVLRNFETWSGIAKRLTQLDGDMKFLGVGYAYPKSPQLWDDLLTQACKEAQERKLRYEQCFKVKLKLSYLRDNRIKPYDEGLGMRKVRMMAATDNDGGSADDLSTLLPTRQYGINLDVGYSIIN